MADVDKIKRNIKKMIDGGAAENEIDQYLSMEGVTVDHLKQNYGLSEASEPSMIDNAISTVGGGARTFLDGTFGGFADELHGAVTALPRAGYNAYQGEGFDIGQGYEQGRDDWRNKSDQFSNENPITSAGLEVGGGLASAAAMPWLAPAKGATTMAQVGKGVTTGMGLGAVYGAGNADGDLMDRAQGAATGATIGGVTGGLAVPAIKVAGKGVEAVGNQLKGRSILGHQIGNANDAAGRKVVEALQRDGLSLTQAEARIAKLGPEAALMDVGPNSQSLARSVYTRPGAGKTAVGDFLHARQEGVRNPATKVLEGGQINRVSQTIDDMIPNDVRGTRQATQAERTARGANYEAAKSADEFVDLKALAQDLDAEIMKSKGDIKAGLKRVRETLNTGDGVLDESIEGLHQSKVAIDAMMDGSSKNSVDRITKGKIKEYQNRLVDAIESAGEAGSQYREGRLGTAAAWRIDDALDSGEQFMLKRAGTADDLADALKNMRPEEQEAFRQGVAQAIKSKLGDMNARTDVTKRLMDIPNLEAKIKTAFGDDATFQKYIQNLENEKAMFDSYGRIIGGSRTAEVTAEQADAAIDHGRVAQGLHQIINPTGITDPFQGAVNVAGGVKDKIMLPQPMSEQLADILTKRSLSGLRGSESSIAIGDQKRRALAKMLTTTGAVGGGNVNAP